MDAPRETFQRVVTLAPDARGKHRARWLVGDVARLVVQTLEDGEARPARLALQLCARLVAHDYADGADARPHGNDVVDAGESDDDDAAHRLREGDQVLVYAAKLWSGPRSGRCVGARGDRVDVRMDRGGAFADVPVVAEAPSKGEAPVARPATAARRSPGTALRRTRQPSSRDRTNRGRRHLKPTHTSTRVAPRRRTRRRPRSRRAAISLCLDRRRGRVARARVGPRA